MKTIYGLTGNMGCGKSTVLALLERDSEIQGIKTDDLAKEVLKRPEVIEELKRNFGSRILSEDKLNYKFLAEVFFQERSILRNFEAIIHPLVWEKMDEIILESSKNIFVVESAIIFETGNEDRFDKIICVTCREDIQQERLGKRGLTNQEIANRLKFQLSSGFKEKHADYVIHNNGSPLETMRIVNQLIYDIKEGDHEY